jgi:hypothetical protein
MRVLSVRPEHSAEDIETGRITLRDRIANPSTLVMIMRGVDPDVRHFADMAAARSDPFPWRDLVWVTDEAIFPVGSLDRWFGQNPNDCAVILDLRDRPTAWLPVTAELFEIEDAFLAAEGRAP